MSFRVLKDFGVNKLFNLWSRSYFLSNVVKRCRRDRVRDIIQCFRHTFLRPRRTLLLSATAAFHRGGDDEDSCENSISDEDLAALVTELDTVEDLSLQTLFCGSCGCRLVIDKKHPGVQYCVCNTAHAPTESEGWVPFMEADDVIIWRKEYKPGQGLYAYKVYGRYKEVKAQDFASVQIDGAYRRVWDNAVASLSVVERNANGVPDQAVLHWEVLWPRLFANRDYVYIRRHKEYDIKTKSRQKDVFRSDHKELSPEERQNVHSHAKRKALEAEKFVTTASDKVEDNRVYIIVSKSCSHPSVPESKYAIRVSEYWSHMVIKTISGVDQPGMEFVLTYYDEPCVGGMPGGVAAWATGRAAPAYLQRMRSAALHYRGHPAEQELPDFVPGKDSNGEERTEVKEEDMESSQQGPELNGKECKTKDQCTQTDPPNDKCSSKKINNVSKSIQTNDDEKPQEETSASWWRYLYPFYYFV